MTSGLYTAAMLAELVGVHVSRIRSWQRRGWLVPVQQTHRLAYFDFQELTVARQLAELQRGGATPRWLAKNLAQIERKFPDAARPLAVLRLMIEGRTLLVRRGDDLVEPGGQLRIDFDAASREAENEPPPTVPSQAIFLSREPLQTSADAAPQQLLVWAAEMDEAGNLKQAAEMYRAALAAGGPQPEVCFHLAEVLYRAGDLSGARERYFAALEMDEDYVEARANLGCILLELGETDLAISAFAGALRSHEAYADVHYHLARTLDEVGRRDEAADHWQRFVELAPESPWAEEARERLQDTQ